MASAFWIVIGVFILFLGFVFIITHLGFLVGWLFVIFGIALIAWGVASRAEVAELRRTQEETRFLLEQQGELIAASAAHPPSGPSDPSVPTPSAPSNPLAYERECPLCGRGNARAAAYCQWCGKPLPRAL
jgi:hypothetical protein